MEKCNTDGLIYEEGGVRPAGNDKSEIIVSPPPERVQLCHDCVQAEQIVTAVLLCLK